ncbi:MAG: helix-turn-helix domain-containing protein [Clostridia bacterium]|nr:helix-turn-helix domain-containing protein [Clostridia bacterium]
MNIYALNLRLDQKKCSYKDLAELLGISRSSLYRKLSGQTDFTCTEIAGIRQHLALTDTALIEIFFHNNPV